MHAKFLQLDDDLLRHLFDVSTDVSQVFGWLFCVDSLGALFLLLFGRLFLWDGPFELRAELSDKIIDKKSLARAVCVLNCSEVGEQIVDELKRCAVAHAVVLQHEGLVLGSAEAGVQIAEVVKEDLVDNCCFALTRVTADVHQA